MFTVNNPNVFWGLLVQFVEMFHFFFDSLLRYTILNKILEPDYFQREYIVQYYILSKMFSNWDMSRDVSEACMVSGAIREECDQG
jgi:hypothetical protein